MNRKLDRQLTLLREIDGFKRRGEGTRRQGQDWNTGTTRIQLGYLYHFQHGNVRGQPLWSNLASGTGMYLGDWRHARSNRARQCRRFGYEKGQEDVRDLDVRPPSNLRIRCCIFPQDAGGCHGKPTRQALNSFVTLNIKQLHATVIHT